MSKLYVFAIGGTGSRVLRAMTMLLASGVKCNADTIVPIIIDPDAAAGDVERTVNLMQEYQSIRSRLAFEEGATNGFFRTGIQDVTQNFRFTIQNTQNESFSDYINLEGMIENSEVVSHGNSMRYSANQALARVLFSHKNMSADMTVGFKGNPNIGSVVLNQFEDSQEFQEITNDFGAQDKIFIISSIFGGTGASGFPLLLKTLRNTTAAQNQNFVRNANIGAVTVLPYFQVKPDQNSAIDSATFVSKAKSALAYYDHTISRAAKGQGIDYLYYIADDIRTSYENSEGGQTQRNNAHFIELASALALIDFTFHDKPAQTQHMEFGIETDTNEIVFDTLCDDTRKQIRKPMTQFLLFSKYLKEYDDYLNKPWTKDRQMDDTFFNTDYVKALKRFQDQYQGWLHEMTTQDRQFCPFLLHEDKSRVFDIIKGCRPKKLFTTDSNYDLFTNKLNALKKDVAQGSKEQQLMDLFYSATETLSKEKLNIQ